MNPATNARYDAPMITEDAIVQVSRRIAPHIDLTPCQPSPSLSEATGGPVFLKLENRQVSGSFKIRGVLNKILSLPSDDEAKALVAASTGNHGAAFVHAVERFGREGMLFMPKTATGVKVDPLRKSGIPLVMSGDDCVDAEMAAAAHARSTGAVWISPYNDPDVVAGQGTIGVELMEQMETIDAVIVPVGGGGLISGIAAYLKAVNPSITVIACQPLNSCVMCRSVEAGRVVEMTSLPTLSDATAGGIEAGSMTFDFCRDLVDDFVLLTESEILTAIFHLRDRENEIVEGGAAMPVAAVLREPERYFGQRVALVISGGRIDPEVFDRIDDTHPHASNEEQS